jgi:hypothetical protein
MADPAPAPVSPSVQNWTPFRSDFPAFVLGTAFEVVHAGKISKDGAATLTHCAVELELWALGQYFGTRPVVGGSLPTPISTTGGNHILDLPDAEAHQLLDQPEPAEGLVGWIPPISAGIALKLAIWLLKTAAGVLL